MCENELHKWDIRYQVSKYDLIGTADVRTWEPKLSGLDVFTIVHDSLRGIDKVDLHNATQGSLNS
jgi:hypothetical protein